MKLLNCLNHSTLLPSKSSIVARRSGIALAAVAMVFFWLDAVGAQAPSVSQVETIAAFDQVGENPESLVIDRGGNIYVSLASRGEVRKIAPDLTQTTLATLPNGTGTVNGLTIDRQQNIYAALASGDASTHGVWSITPDGGSQRIAALAPETGLNGMTFDRRGNLFVSDSRQGAIWRIARGSDQAELWLQSDLLTPLTGSQFPIGANGVKFWRNDLFVSSTDRQTIVRVPVNADGSAGTSVIYLEGLRCDDFLIDKRGNLYVATGFLNEVVRVDRQLNREVLLTDTDGIDSPSALAFGRLRNDRNSLYISNLGFLNRRPSVMKVRLMPVKPQDTAR